MLESLEPPLSLDGILKLLIALILLSFFVALLQSDSTVAAVRRAVNNFAALPLLLIVDLISGVEMILTSGHARSIFTAIWKTSVGVTDLLRKTIEDANFSVRIHRALLTAYRIAVQYADAAQHLAGRITRLFTIVQALLSIVYEAGTNYIRVLRAGRSISDDALFICNLVLHSSIYVISLLYVVSKSLGNLMSAITIKTHKHLRRSAVYASFANLVLSIPAIVTESLSLGSSTHMSSSSRDVTPASKSIYQSPWKGRLRARTSGADKRQ
ncbi:hypothetical protein E4T50_00074 [Aureobasidium sp. EXF-12298]|nr:hypothetical protein E4T50_00074 [Aureobasidium sp. EXF-12298]KAI4783079.1 hypothetical protein E4T52_02056 [Aureobasidium sp. EXF-3400]